MISLLLYRILLLILSPLILALLLVRSKNNKAYRQRLLERFGYFPSPAKQGGIVVHAASVGEVIALKSFIEKLLTNYPDLPITVTAFTPTGSAQIVKAFGDRVQQGYLPLDIFPCTSLFLYRLKPKMMIFMETELWPNLIAQCASKDIKLLLINGRLSQKSLTSYQKLSPLIKPCLLRFDKILTQSQENLRHFLQLGAQKKQCLNSGNLKFDIAINDHVMNKKRELSQLLFSNNTQKNRTVILMASTHEGDEVIALSAFKKLLAKDPSLLLIIVPRHPERFSAVADLCLAQQLSLAKRSDNVPVSDNQVWLIDSLGELMAVFALSDIVIMGGSFSEVGGHNPLEPALFNKPIIVGHNMSNFNEIMEQLTTNNAVIQLLENESIQQLVNEVTALLAHPTQQRVLGDNAHNVVLANQGASDFSLTQVTTLLPNHNAKGDHA